MRSRVLLFVSIGILVIAVVVFAAAVQRESSPASQAARNTAQSAGTSGRQPAGVAVDQGLGEVMTTGLFRAIAKRQNPIVVAITTQSRVEAANGLPQIFGDDDFFSRFFGGTQAPQPRSQLRVGLGSGVLIGSNGEIITNNHVVAGAQQIRVGLFGDEDGKTYVADVVGRDPLTDSALIKLEKPPAHLPAADLGNSDTLQPGDWVMAIGNPFELGHTVTVGVISYNGRPFATTEGRFQNMLQTDASINPGNSGGPLIDIHGQVIGLNTAILSGNSGGGNVGIGFAVPINTVKALLPQLRKGTVQRGQLGVQILSAPVSEDEAKQLGLPKAEGAVVSRVEPDSPAGRAGIRAGDVIVRYDGKAVPNSDTLTNLVVNTSPGTKVPLVLYRDGREQQLTVTIGQLDLGDSAASGDEAQGTAHGFGLSLRDLTPDIARQLRVPASTDGAVVDNVEPFTPASNAGLQRGDVILEVNRQPVQSAGAALRLLRAVPSGKPVFLLVSRNGVQQFLAMHKE